jgi:hypothetical protein
MKAIMPTGFYCVNEGIVKLFKTGTEGREQIIAFAKKGGYYWVSVGAEQRDLLHNRQGDF